jgi:hypothetical protein
VVTNGLLITSFIQFFAFVGFGLLGQIIGRRPAIVLSGIATRSAARRSVRQPSPTALAAD